MAPQRRRQTTSSDGTNQEFDTNIEAGEQNMPPLENVNPSDDAMQAAVPDHTLLARILQENTRIMKEFITMMAPLMPAAAAFATAQQGMTSSNPIVVAQPYAAQVTQPPNTLGANTNAAQGNNEQVRTPEPTATQHSTP